MKPLCVLLSLLCFEPQKSVTVSRPTVTVTSPLYVATIDCEYKLCTRLECTVTKEQVKDGGDAERNWWTDPAVRAWCLEADDWNNSGFDRGHLRALLWSRGSDDWPAANMTAVILPETPAANRGPIKALEARIAALAVEKGPVSVLIEVDVSERPVRFGDEVCRLPKSLRYLVTWQDADGEHREEYLIPNSAKVEADPQRYRVK